MDAKLIHEQNGQRTFVIVLATGDEVMETLSSFAIKERIAAAQITGIGALSDVELNYFDWDKKVYNKISVEEQVEVASLLGDVALAPDGTPTLHLKAHVRPTLETILTESPAHLRKVYDPDSRLALIRPHAM